MNTANFFREGGETRLKINKNRIDIYLILLILLWAFIAQ